MVAWDEVAAGTAQFINAYGLTAIFVVMLVKESGIPVPIPSDLIMLAAAVQSASGAFVLWQVFMAIWTAMVVGAWAQYTLVRGIGRPLLYRLGRYVGLTQERLDHAADAVRRGGAVAVGVSLVTPGLRIGTVPACGIARLPYRSFFPGVVAGSGVFLGLHFVIVYLAIPILSLAAGPGLELVALFAALLLLGLGGWMVMRRGAPAHRHGRTVVTLDRLRNWSDASCPVCLVVGAFYYFRHLRHARGH